MAFHIVNLLLTFLGLVLVVSILVMWVLALIGAFTRKDLKNNRWVWVLFILFVSPIGHTVYFFVEGQKKRGIISLVGLLGLPLLVTIYAIMNFFLMSSV